MDKINEANSNMPMLSTPFFHIRSPVKPKEELTNTFITDLSHQDNNQVLMKEAPQLKEWPTFTGEGEYDRISTRCIIGNEVDIILNVEKPYPPLLRRPAYPAGPRARETLEVYIEELMDLGVLRKVGHNEQLEVTTPVIITWHNGKSRMVADFRALNTYTIPDRYPIPRIHKTLIQLS
ncbi:hypothetical protein O181_056337 [Austropuccinia psidii MF-1]|uniref:Reverse transcriptase domain-containing protein n=1 Tax=Austropuccinia psidii MF-1 TaxID=1389203 RepID=A0A9Q3EAL6_9BASI|nr:hypothetical protein [Austropuccinia psidii MF-1]